VVETDQTGKIVTSPGFTFSITVGTAGGQLVATISTDATGIAIAGALNPATYCVTQTAAPDGFQVMPTYSPSACVAVAADPTQGRNPTTVTVSDPVSSAPSPSAEPSAAAIAPTQQPSPPAAPTRRLAAQPSQDLPIATLAKVLVGFGVLLLLAGGTLVAIEVRRRRAAAGAGDGELPTDVWYDSTIR
jgi:hypothetical protein